MVAGFSLFGGLMAGAATEGAGRHPEIGSGNATFR
jgi:hypothetical protein